MSKNEGSSSAGAVGEDLYNQASSAGSGGIFRETKRGPPVVGYRKPIRDNRMVRYDRVGARAKPPVEWEVTKDDRMSAKEAGDKMEELYVVYNLKGAAPEILEAFHSAMYFSHTMNSASVLQPGRADIVLQGNPMPFRMAVLHLGNDLRRFFRAFADEVREENLRILNQAKDSMDIVAQEKAAWLRQVADERGLSRYPHLAHDTSDACWNLSDGERSALTASKAMVFGSTPNAADRNRFRPGQSSATEVGSMFVSPTAQGHALADR